MKQLLRTSRSVRDQARASVLLERWQARDLERRIFEMQAYPEAKRAWGRTVVLRIGIGRNPLRCGATAASWMGAAKLAIQVATIKFGAR